IGGRAEILEVENSQHEIKADMVIEALGFEAEDIPVIFSAPELKLSKHGTISVNNDNFMTSIDGVFAAGDIVRGASLVVWAIKDGREAATSIDNWILNKR
ncbi:MAG: FAD-dependent oxidoreductase, partial [Pseudomonadota bacterium]